VLLIVMDVISYPGQSHLEIELSGHGSVGGPSSKMAVSVLPVGRDDETIPDVGLWVTS
jgi:hypothetical protein